MINLEELKATLIQRLNEIKSDFNANNILSFIKGGADSLNRILGFLAIYLKDIEEMSGTEKRELIIQIAMSKINIKWLPDFIERKIYYMAINYVVERFKRKGWDIKNLI